jgi:hypothetical protein
VAEYLIGGHVAEGQATQEHAAVVSVVVSAHCPHPSAVEPAVIEQGRRRRTWIMPAAVRDIVTAARPAYDISA